MASTTPAVKTQGDLEGDESTPGLVRKVVFRTDDNALVQVEAAGGVSSGWHHHGDRHVYAHLVEGSAVIEYGPGGTDRLEIEPGGFFHLPPRLVHRDVNPVDEPQRWVISFVGSGPLVENVDAPAAD